MFDCSVVLLAEIVFMRLSQFENEWRMRRKCNKNFSTLNGLRLREEADEGNAVVSHRHSKVEEVKNLPLLSVFTYTLASSSRVFFYTNS